MLTPKFRKVVIYDYSGYEAGMSSNGGDYGFWIEYYPEAADKYSVHYFTTAEFGYCEYCGQFTRGDCGCGHYPEIVTEQELLREIEEANRNASEDIYAEVEVWSLNLSKFRNRLENSLRKTDNLSILLKVAGELGVSLTD